MMFRLQMFLAYALLWLSQRVTPKRTPAPMVTWTRDSRADAVFAREFYLHRLHVADALLGRVLGWKATEERQ